jgi:hypothetical protein
MYRTKDESVLILGFYVNFLIYFYKNNTFVLSQNCSACHRNLRNNHQSFRNNLNQQNQPIQQQHHHFRNRRPAIRQPSTSKKCTFATTTTTILPSSKTTITHLNDHRIYDDITHTHHPCQSQSSNSSNTSSIRIIE